MELLRYDDLLNDILNGDADGWIFDLETGDEEIYDETIDNILFGEDFESNEFDTLEQTYELSKNKEAGNFSEYIPCSFFEPVTSKDYDLLMQALWLCDVNLIVFPACAFFSDETDCYKVEFKSGHIVINSIEDAETPKIVRDLLFHLDSLKDARDELFEMEE